MRTRLRPFAPRERTHRVGPRWYALGVGPMREQARPSSLWDGCIGGRFRGSDGRGGRLDVRAHPLAPCMFPLILCIGSKALRVQLTKSRVGPTALGEGPSIPRGGPSILCVPPKKSRVDRIAEGEGTSAQRVGVTASRVGATGLCMNRNHPTRSPDPRPGRFGPAAPGPRASRAPGGR